MKNRIFSAVLCALMLLGMVLAVPQALAAEGSIAEAGGWNETIYAKLAGVSPSDVTAVSYSGTTSGSLSQQDLQYLVREEGGHTRIDILGVPAGTYTLTVTTKTGQLRRENIVVEAQDRSGYAHFGTSEGVGAYNNDGTLKKNAIVLYVTDANKDTVTVTSADGTTVTGIGNILNSVGMDAGGGVTSKGGKANSNQDIIRKLAKDGTPLVVRIIGNVTAPTGLTAYDSVDYGGSVGDNGFMARMSGGKNVTIEGVGTGATMDGWGVHFICQSSDYASGLGRSFEVRNLTFKNVPEDCVGMEGQQDDSTLTAPVERCWIHHCAFYAPTVAKPAESDKDGGDGACDFKRGQYFTNSYCFYNGYHKTNLVGSSDSSLQYHMTYHHNYWKDCESRGPLARQANIHMYNNIFEGQTSYCMNPRADAYIFSEYNLFLRCKDPVTVKSGAVKSYGDSFTSCIGDNHATVVADKTAQVSTNCRYANFDTSSSLSYIPSGNYILQEDITQMKAVVMAEAGPQSETILSAADVNTSVIPAGRYPTAAVALPYDHNLSSSYITAKSGTFDNVVFNVSKTASDQLTLGGTAGCDIVFYVDTAVSITMKAVSGTYLPVLCNAVGENLLEGSGTVTDLPAGFYFIQSGAYDVGSGKFKESKISALTITAYDPDAPTQPIPPTPDPDPNPVDPPGGGDGGSVVIPTGGYVHDFTESGLSSEFYAISGNLSTSKGTVTYGELTLTRCLKIETATNISFQAPADGTLVLVFGGTTNAAGKTIKVDGAKQTIGSDNILTVKLAAGSHTVTKGDSINLFYMTYVPDSDPGQQEHQHSFTPSVTTPPTCTEPGVMTDSCACGHSNTRPIEPTGHSYGPWVTVLEPAPGEPGRKEQTCNGCGHVIYEEIPALPVPNPDPIDPTEPTVPTNPTNPTEPTDPTVPTEPTVPTNPTNPTEPTVRPTPPATTPSGDDAQEPSGSAWPWIVAGAALLAALLLILTLVKKKGAAKQ